MRQSPCDIHLKGVNVLLLLGLSGLHLLHGCFLLCRMR